MSPNDSPPICDYEGSTYRTDFWEGRGRDYEDRAERIALRKLLPARGQRLLELGAGFGRLTGEYKGYAQVVLLDYSRTQLKQAQEHLGRDPRFVYVAADVYQMPFRAGAFDGVTMVRVLHHIAQIEIAIREIFRVTTPGATFVLEYANKRNLKAMLRYWRKQQAWNPFDEKPIEFVELNFDFHPAHVQRALLSAGFEVRRRLPVSLLRLPQLKQRVSPEVLAGIDGVFQETGLLVTPSVFVGAHRPGAGAVVPAAGLFVCPRCGGELHREGDVMVCQRDGLRWSVRDGIYDFKAPIND
jgi:SAM-dependent methyltransferase